MSTAETAINAIKEKSAMLEGYAEVLGNLKACESWYTHEDEETGEIVDDEGDYAKYRLIAVRNAIAAVKKLAGV